MSIASFSSIVVDLADINYKENYHEEVGQGPVTNKALMISFYTMRARVGAGV